MGTYANNSNIYTAQHATTKLYFQTLLMLLKHSTAHLDSQEFHLSGYSTNVSLTDHVRFM